MQPVNCDWELTPNTSAVVLRPFTISAEPRGTAQGTMSRADRVVQSVLAMTPEECARQLAEVDRDFHGRHWQTHAIFLKRFRQVQDLLGGLEHISEDYAKLVGAFFSHEYSYAAAAIMNPSIVPHPDQSGMRDGAVRFVMSLRTVGEGHISTITFREGVAYPDGVVALWPAAPFGIAADPSEIDGEGGPVTLHKGEDVPLSGLVLFPTTRAQRNGLEDLRLTPFVEDDGSRHYIGTYTAYSGREVGCELLETERFADFRLTPLRGAAAQHKGLALFPRRIGGRYAAIHRLDHESLYFLQSDDRYTWNYGRKFYQPTEPWELIQTGNCGPPIETKQGWLVLTHGVGALRQYSIGAVLLDRDEPWKVLGRLKEPFLRPLDETREGYVPNVVYTCGSLRVGARLIIPYGVADFSVRCTSLMVDEMIAEMVAAQPVID